MADFMLGQEMYEDEPGTFYTRKQGSTQILWDCVEGHGNPVQTLHRLPLAPNETIQASKSKKAAIY